MNIGKQVMGTNVPKLNGIYGFVCVFIVIICTDTDAHPSIIRLPSNACRKEQLSEVVCVRFSAIDATVENVLPPPHGHNDASQISFMYLITSLWSTLLSERVLIGDEAKK